MKNLAARSFDLSLSLCVALAAGAGGLAACDDPAAADGTLAVTIYGEEFIEEGIPADVFNDGWSVTFAKFLVVVGEVEAARGDDDTAPVSAPAFRVWNVAAASAGAGQQVISMAAGGGAYDHVGYRIKPTTDATAGNADAADVTLMNQSGCAVYVEGVAQKGAEQKTFLWCFDTDTTYSHCASTAEVDGGTATAQITIHGDHLFYDDLVATEPNVSFATLALADGDMDGELTEAELGAFDITALERYQVGSLPVTNLWAFVRQQTSTLGHIDGEGHCETALAP